jgi:hypothetical protein
MTAKHSKYGGAWRGRRWSNHEFTQEQLLKRNIRSANTRMHKKGVKPTLPKLKCLEGEREEEDQ